MIIKKRIIWIFIFLALALLMLAKSNNTPSSSSSYSSDKPEQSLEEWQQAKRQWETEHGKEWSFGDAYYK